MKIREFAKVCYSSGAMRRRIGDVVICNPTTKVLLMETEEDLERKGGVIVRVNEDSPIPAVVLCAFLNLPASRRRLEDLKGSITIPATSIRELDVPVPDPQHVQELVAMLLLVRRIEQNRAEQDKLMKELIASATHRVMVQGMSLKSKEKEDGKG